MSMNIVTSIVGIIMLFVVSMGCFVYVIGALISDLFNLLKRDSYVWAAIIWAFCLTLMYFILRG